MFPKHPKTGFLFDFLQTIQSIHPGEVLHCEVTAGGMSEFLHMNFNHGPTYEPKSKDVAL